jgi:hypothetical protein
MGYSSLLAVMIVLAGCSGLTAQSKPAAQPDVAAIYFPGYHRDMHYDAWFGEGWNEWKLLAEAPTRFPGQHLFKPEWGPFDEADPKMMERQVTLAVDHGVSVFVFDWYWYSGVRILHRPLENGLLKAGNRDKIKFALMWANHNWNDYFPVPLDREMHQLLPIRHSPEDFARVMEYCAANYFRQPNYWRVDGAMYFSIFDSGALLKQLGGPAKTREVLDAARRLVASARLGKMHFAAFCDSPGEIPKLRDAGFAITTCYTITASGKARLPEQPLDEYADLMERSAAFWKEMDTGVLPHMPTVTVGWDPSPRWVKNAPWPPPGDKGYPYTTLVINNTPERFGQLVGRAVQQAESARLRPPGILINAWNEWTEGSALLPEVQYKTQFLEQLKGALKRAP